MAFVAYDPILGEVDLSIVDTSGPGPFNILNGGSTYGRNSQYMGELRGYDVNLGGGTFVYAKFGATLTAGAVVQFTESLSSGQVISTANAWTGTANSGAPLGVAVSAGTTSNWGWFQVQGNAITNVSGAPTANTPTYWQANGVISGTAVAGKQMEGSQFSTTNGVTLGSGNSAVALPSTQAVVLLQYPSGQGAIT
jgi:hypothetical protein